VTAHLPAAGYALTPTREGLAGILDKKALIEATAEEYSVNRELQDLVLRAVSGAGNAADEQLWAWERFLESLPYRREPGEIIRQPTATGSGLGGDCDDLTTLALAGCLALGIPCEAEVVADSSMNGFHVRAIAGLPPLNPEFTVVIDPVHRSEPEWAMANRDLHSASERFRGVNLNVNANPLAGNPTLSGLNLSWWMKVGVALALAWVLLRKR